MSTITPGETCPVCSKRHRAGSKPLAACTAKLTEAPKPQGREARWTVTTETDARGVKIGREWHAADSRYYVVRMGERNSFVVGVKDGKPLSDVMAYGMLSDALDVIEDMEAIEAQAPEATGAPKGYPYESQGLQRTETRLTEARATIAGFVSDNAETPYAVGRVSGSITAAISEAGAWLECSKGSRALADLIQSLQGLSANIESLWAKRETPSFILGMIDQGIQGILETHYIGYDPEDTQGLYLDAEGTFYSASGPEAEVIRVITVDGEIMASAFHTQGTSRYTDVPEEDVTGETLLWISYTACLGNQLTKAGIHPRVISNLMSQGF